MVPAKQGLQALPAWPPKVMKQGYDCVYLQHGKFQNPCFLMWCLIKGAVCNFVFTSSLYLIPYTLLASKYISTYDLLLLNYYYYFCLITTVM